ncbi:hypothetical protein [Candidatus Mycoplasma mahonii]|uniref:hypothetical protein n=1 Tax=Candidatus Mycoplasma mahonii TaxID=3004105 RepID=UPI0026EC2C49|nr:hypothetical protein [Candidatus Mycoplasma mahonii]WKX02703.1 hypothetical protein O3I44_01345 [Candidatus Mycoplasma mahonii]
MDFITDNQFDWLPPIILVVLLLIGGLVGWFLGWKSSLYFLIWNILGLVTGVLIVYYLYDIFINKTNFEIIIINIKKILTENKFITKSIIGAIITLVSLIVFNLFAFIFYWVFRSTLKRSLKDAKKAKKSILLTRTLGSTIGVISTIPASLFATTLSTTMSGLNKFTHSTSKMVDFITIGQFKNLDENIKHVIYLVDATLKFNDFKSEFSEIFKNIEVKPMNNEWISKLNIPENIETIKKILNSPILANSFETLLGDTLKIDKTKIDFSLNPKKVYNGAPLVTNTIQKGKLITQIEIYFKNNASSMASWENINAYLMKIGLF